MPATMTSRERMLAAIECRETDYIPCCFMIFAALSGRCVDDAEFVRREVEMGLDAFVPTASWAVTRNPEHRDLPGIDLRFAPQVEIRQWREQRTDGSDVLYKEYITPDGTLTTQVEATDDWPLPDYVPLFDDYLVPRARKFPVEGIDDLAALRHLLAAPHPEDVAVFRARADRARDLADELGLLLRAGMGVGMDASAWLCGMEQVMFRAFDQPEFVDGLAGILHEWNVLRMKEILAVKPGLFIRRGWYEGTDFWSPPMYERFILPYLKREVDLAHEMGAKFGYVHTTGTMGVLDLIMAAGVDVLIGVDPIEGMGTDMALMRERTRGRMALWGGVNGFITVEMGTDDEIREAVADAISTLGPLGFILSPVDNVRDPSEDTMRRVDVFVDTWRRMR